MKNMQNDEITHDPKEFARGLQQILISDTKKIGFLFGAGTSYAVKKNSSVNSRVPTVRDITEKTVEEINTINKEYKNALDEIKEEFKDSAIDFNIEYLLSNIIQKALVIGKGTLCGLKKEDFVTLRGLIEKKIIEFVSVHKKKESYLKDLIHCDFAQWIGQASRKFPIEIFTTNYDYLFELGLEYHSIPYFDGFIGSFEPFFNPVFVEDLDFLPNVTKLWKIHGSLGWDSNSQNKRVIRRYQDDKKIIVFPSLQKYDDSKKQPYIGYLDRLSKFIKQDDAVLFVCGYSFGDEHINGVILDALANTRTSHVIAMMFDKYNDNEGKRAYTLEKDSPIVRLGMNQTKLSVYGFRSAVIGGKFGNWKLKSEPSRDDSLIIDYYFDEDGPENPDIKEKVETSGGLKWTGKGEFILPDFESFVKFLSYLNYENYLSVNNKNE
jgi:hypothetical protein